MKNEVDSVKALSLSLSWELHLEKVHEKWKIELWARNRQRVRERGRQMEQGKSYNLKRLNQESEGKKNFPLPLYTHIHTYILCAFFSLSLSLALWYNSISFFNETLIQTEQIKKKRKAKDWKKRCWREIELCALGNLWFFSCLPWICVCFFSKNKY
jgi:hypothetical protein